MTLSRLVIYTTAHGVDSVDAHLKTLRDSDISPGLVALELPDVDDVASDLNTFVRELAVRSPATGIVWHLVEGATQAKYEETANVANRRDSEFEAGRRYAEEREIPHVSVDLSRAEIAERYVTWPRRLRDIVFLVTGFGITIVAWGIAVLLGLASLAFLVGQGPISQRILDAVIRLVIAVILCYIGIRSVQSTVEKIGRWLRDTIRELRNEAMYRRIERLSSRRSLDEVVLITGAAHHSGIEALANQDGVDCRQIESPAIARYDGDVDAISLAELSELTEDGADG